jgi:hypothetical protein
MISYMELTNQHFNHNRNQINPNQTLVHVTFRGSQFQLFSQSQFPNQVSLIK